MKSRIQYIDMAKGLTILLVIVGHIDTTNILRQAIYSFHMPLFFILSGYFIKTQISLTTSLKKMFRTLIVPYLVVGGVIALCKFLTSDTTFLFEIKKLVFVMWKYNGEVFSMGPIWFLTALFGGKLWILITSKSKHMIPLIVFGALLSLLFTRFTNIVIPFTIQHALTCAPFLLIGMKIREHGIFEVKLNKQTLYSVGLACAVFAPLMSVAMFSNSLNTFNYFSASIISILLIHAIIEFQTSHYNLQIISDFLSWCGRYSLMILAFHTIDDELHLLTLPHNLWPIEILLRCSATVLVTWLMIKIKPIRHIFCA